MAGAIRIGIGGWTYEPWRGGVFYPEGLPQKRELDYAAERLTAIEINGTYYGSQRPATFAAWAKAVPDGFVFTLKASRFCTNRRVLAEGAESVEKFLSQGITELGDRLGPILWQFMATKHFQPDDFAAFLQLLPKERDGLRLRHALEVRHESFRDPAFYELARQANAAIVLADTDEHPVIDEATADFSYARLMRAQADVETGYDAPGLDAWAGRARAMAERGDAFLFFIAGAKARNPAAAQALIERVGRP